MCPFLGFDPCSLFMSALASDIEDERRPSSSTVSSRLSSNPHQHYPSHYSSHTNPMTGQINPTWFTQNLPQQPYQQYSDSQDTTHTNGSVVQKQQQPQRYQLPFSMYSMDHRRRRRRRIEKKITSLLFFV
jgi:hypothetical protein